MTKLFEEIITEFGLNGFRYIPILKEMTNKNFNNRIKNFFEIERMILTDSSDSIDFSESDKEIYQSFADSLYKSFVKIEKGCEYVSNFDTFIKELEETYNNSMLENVIQNISPITKVFVKGNYYYRPGVLFYVETLKDFFHFFKSASDDKKKIILNNLWLRLDKITRYNDSITDDDVPF